MEVKKNLEVGELIKWKPTISGHTGDAEMNRQRLLRVTEVYKHHIITEDIEEPHLRFSIQNVDLYIAGLIKKEDVVRPKTANMNTVAMFKDICIS